MDARSRIPNLVLRRIRVEERHETRAEFAEALARKAQELDEPLAPSERYVARLEDGDIKYPQPAYRRALVELCGRSITELGFAAPTRVIEPVTAPPSSMLLRHRSTANGILVAASGTVETITAIFEHGLPMADSQWPTWFGIRLAHLIALVDAWQIQSAPVASLQDILTQEILMFNSPAIDDPGYPDYVQSRRQALTTLSALPLAFATTTMLSTDDARAGAQESFLAQCAASLTACWHLLRGSDLTVIDHILSTYLLPLEGIAHQSSKYQQTAAVLASQTHRIRGIVALHHNQIAVREHHCKQALRYANVASDAGSQASALISLASTYFYNSDPERAAATYERAFALGAQMPPLQRSRVYAELSVVYGQIGRDQDALRSARLAEDIYPDDPEDDPSYLYAEFTPASLTLEQGLAQIALAEHDPDHRYQHEAAQVLARIDHATSPAVPDRIRFEIANNQARAAVLLDDLEAFEFYFHRGLDGAVLLGSRQRASEARLAWQRAAQRWPSERRVQALTERLRLTAGEGDGGSA